VLNQKKMLKMYSLEIQDDNETYNFLVSKDINDLAHCGKYCNKLLQKQNFSHNF
jgi:hypothetical protein